MSDKTNQPTSDELQFEEATGLTIEEAVQKEADLAAGVTAEDSVLDKYIKKNREKVGEQKFVNKDKVNDLSTMDTSTLDNFIEKQRQELEETGILPTPVLGATDQLPLGALGPGRTPFDTIPATEETPNEAFYDETFLDDHQKSRQKWVIGGLAALLLVTVGLAYGLNQLKVAAPTTNNSTAATSSSASSSSSAAAADVKAFDDLYQGFFVDEALTKPKNSEFGNLPLLESALKKLEGTSDYEAAKDKYDSLKKSIAAITALNDKFETPAIVDGEKVAAKLKDGATLDDLTTSVLNTGRASLDTLLQAVITEARGLPAGGSLTGSAVAKTPASSSETAASSSSATSAAVSASTEVATAPAVASYGLTSYDPAILQRHLSRVPYNDALVADKANPAWTFNPGVMEEIIRVSQQRGYISGYDFILEPVNIVNSNGYYNMYRPDGTYLFSINAKTGYFVGNGSGYADALDY